MNLAALLEDLTHVPHLPGAKCRQHPALFDATIPSATNRPRSVKTLREALQVCREQCPCLAACTAWLDTIPPAQRPHGVIAGRTNTWLERRPP